MKKKENEAFCKLNVIYAFYVQGRSECSVFVSLVKVNFYSRNYKYICVTVNIYKRRVSRIIILYAFSLFFFSCCRGGWGNFAHGAIS